MDTIYRQLQRKLNTMGLGYPETDEGYELIVLQELYTEEEASFALAMPLGVHTAAEVAADMGIPEAEAEERLMSMSRRSLVFRLHDGDTVKYYLLPVIHGFLEFAIDRFNPTIARYFSKHYVNGMGKRFYGSTEPLFRILPLRRELVEGDECLPGDDVEAIIRRQDRIALTECFCRLSANTNPKATGCKYNPDFSELCMAFGIFADFYVENGNGRYITQEEALEHMRQCDANGNVIEVLNSKDVEVMCSCCPCCCGVMKALLMFGGPSADIAGNYQIAYDREKCVQCGKCAARCFMKGITAGKDGKIRVNQDKCVGCGLCVSTCPTGAVTLHRKHQLYLPPTQNVLELYDYVRELRRKTTEI